MIDVLLFLDACSYFGGFSVAIKNYLYWFLQRYLLEV